MCVLSTRQDQYIHISCWLMMSYLKEVGGLGGQINKKQIGLINYLPIFPIHLCHTENTLLVQIYIYANVGWSRIRMVAHFGALQ